MVKDKNSSGIKSGQTIHVVSFDVPYPANYGGVIDVFYRIKALSELGYSIILHCYNYGRGEQEELHALCKKVHYYKRNTGFKSQVSHLPFIVYSRKNKLLLANLLKNDAPILFEGTHCCYYLNHPLLKGRKQIVRIHNIEGDYYKHLAKNEKSIFKKAYYFLESIKLNAFETHINSADALLCISESDTQHYQKHHKNVHWLMPYHPFEKVSVKQGLGNYILYHGNLTVAENKAAVEYILKHIAPYISSEIIISGKTSDNQLKQRLSSHKNVSLKANVDDEEMKQLLQNAQLIFIPTFQDTGLKLKLLYSLYVGRHVLVNSTMTKGSNLEHACYVSNTSADQINTINELITKEVTAQDISTRAKQLAPYQNTTKTQLISKLL